MKVAVVGASGYAGVEAVRLLARHPRFELAALMADQSAGRRLSDLYPALRGLVDAELLPADLDRLPELPDFALLALPAGEAARLAERLVAAGVRVVDLGADFRLRDPEAYRRWYQKEHTAPHLIPEAVYGLTELHREAIAGARLVANPGCYPTAALLAAAPLARAGLAEPRSWVVAALSGVTGAGRSLRVESLFAEVYDNPHAYGLPEHRHLPEMEEELSRLAGEPVQVAFVPHLIPIARGLVCTLVARLRRPVDEAELGELYRSFYRGEPFVEVVDHPPGTREVLGTNRCRLAVHALPGGQAVVTAAIDNLGKGAAGQAVQNLNRMASLPEAAGLEGLPLVP